VTGPVVHMRLVRKAGDVSVMVTLPKGWVERAGLHVGDHVLLEEDGLRLIVRKVTV
jgi:hypothetical protein